MATSFFIKYPGAVSVTANVASNTNGSYAQITNLTNAAQTFTPPANAVGFILENASTNTANVRYQLGGTATTTAGFLLEPGRDSDYIPTNTPVSVITTVASGTTEVNIIWVKSS